jgi:hypothetical protein
MRLILVIILAIMFIGCAHSNTVTCDPIHAPGSVGPCYGSVHPIPSIYGCFYDTNYDKEPDIILFYEFIDGKFSLLSVITVREYEELE